MRSAECGSREKGEWGRVSKRLVNCHDAQSLMEEGEFRGVTVKFRLTLTMKHMHYFLRMADISVLVDNVGPQEFVQTMSYVQHLSNICSAYDQTMSLSYL